MIPRLEVVVVVVFVILILVFLKIRMLQEKPQSCISLIINHCILFVAYIMTYLYIFCAIPMQYCGTEEVPT